ncbi:MAG TPA: hypothetical protein VG935_02420 [Patescibacteria group bacterium]|nr:hypothetical protein [Patescibacteria group bacterium]
MRPFHRIKNLYHEIAFQNRESQFIILIVFILTIIITRTITYLQLIHVLPNQMGPLHIHHMVPGIILALITGYTGIAFWGKKKVRLISAFLFGIGAALTVDEFALWLFLRDVYWEREGRISVEAILIVISVLILVFLINDVLLVHKRRHKSHHFT